MSPRTGRPRKNKQKKDVPLQVKITQETADKLQRCADVLSITRTEVIERGIELVDAQLPDK